MSQYEHERCEELIAELQNELYASRLLNQHCREALQWILAEPYGCAFCDSGKLRNQDKEHHDRCGFAKAQDLIGDETR